MVTAAIAENRQLECFMDVSPESCGFGCVIFFAS